MNVELLSLLFAEIKSVLAEENNLCFFTQVAPVISMATAWIQPRYLHIAYALRFYACSGFSSEVAI